MIDKQSIKKLADTVYECTNSKQRTVELVSWASFGETRAPKMTAFLNNNPKATYAKIQYEMSKIVAEEKLYGER